MLARTRQGQRSNGERGPTALANTGRVNNKTWQAESLTHREKEQHITPGGLSRMSALQLRQTHQRRRPYAKSKRKTHETHHSRQGKAGPEKTDHALMIAEMTWNLHTATQPPAHLPQTSRSGGSPRGPPGAWPSLPLPASHAEVIVSAGRPLGELNKPDQVYRQQSIYLENCKESTKNKDFSKTLRKLGKVAGHTVNN